MNEPISYSAGHFVRIIREKLENQYHVGEAKQLAVLIFEHFCGLTMKDLIIEPEKEVGAETIDLIEDVVKRLLNHEPVQYITERAYFCGHEFFVNHHVLIPRPETEELVRLILDDFSEISRLRVADIGTGSGCVAISLALRLQQARVDAFDISAEALEVAKSNNEELAAGANFYPIDFQDKSAWPDQLYDVVVSNPPYIPVGNKTLLPCNVSAYEPGLALFVPDDDPLLFYRLLADFAGSHLRQQGKLYVEVHEDYADSVVELFKNSGLCKVKLRCDMNGRKRMVRAEKA